MFYEDGKKPVDQWDAKEKEIVELFYQWLPIPLKRSQLNVDLNEALNVYLWNDVKRDFEEYYIMVGLDIKYKFKFIYLYCSYCRFRNTEIDKYINE